MSEPRIEWLPVVLIDGKQSPGYDPIDICPTREAAVEHGLAAWRAAYPHLDSPTGSRVTLAVMFRQVTPWTLHRGIAAAAQAPETRDR